MSGSLPARARVRVPPVARELSGSWLRRLALAYGLPVQDLLRGVLSSPHPVKITGTPHSALEVYLNALARKALADFSGIPLPMLHRLLPVLTPTHPRLTDDHGPQAAWYSPARGWVTACPPCTGRAWTAGRPVLVYPGPAGPICQRHQRWLLADEHKPVSLPLRALPEVLAAHRRHLSLVRRVPQADRVVALAAAVVWSWQVQRWTGESIWRQRTAILAKVTGSSATAAMAHALIAYPETINVAALISNPRWQQRLCETATTRGLQAALHLALEDAGRSIGRSWLADWLTARVRTQRRASGEHDLLLWWLRRLTSPHCPPGTVLWDVPAGMTRPVVYGDRISFLTESPVRPTLEDARAASLTGGWEPCGPLPLAETPRVPWLYGSSP